MQNTPPPYNPPTTRKWYQHPAVVIASLFICFPVGIALVWLSQWTQKTKIIVTAVMVVLVAIGLLQPRETDTLSEKNAVAVEQTTTTTIKPTTTTTTTTTTIPPTTTTIPAPTTTEYQVDELTVQTYAMLEAWNEQSSLAQSQMCVAFAVDPDEVVALVNEGASYSFNPSVIRSFFSNQCGY